MNKIAQKTLQQLFGFKSRNTLNDWNKSGHRVILKLVEKYFNEKDIQEYLATENIPKINNYLEYEKLYLNMKNDIYRRCNDFKKNNNETLLIWKDFINTLDKTQFEVYNLSNYNDEVFESILIAFNEYLLKQKIKNYRQLMQDIETLYESFNVHAYKFYFFKEFMWTFQEPTTIEIIKRRR